MNPHELAEYDPEAIRAWLDGHEKFARPLRDRGEGDPRYGLAGSILGGAAEMRNALAQYKQPVSLLRELRIASAKEWGKVHPEKGNPPQDVWDALTAEAGKRAFREQCPQLAQLAGDIAEMRTHAESMLK